MESHAQFQPANLRTPQRAFRLHWSWLQCLTINHDSRTPVRNWVLGVLIAISLDLANSFEFFGSFTEALHQPLGCQASLDMPPKVSPAIFWGPAVGALRGFRVFIFKIAVDSLAADNIECRCYLDITTHVVTKIQRKGNEQTIARLGENIDSKAPFISPNFKNERTKIRRVIHTLYGHPVMSRVSGFRSSGSVYWLRQHILHRFVSLMYKNRD